MPLEELTTERGYKDRGSFVVSRLESYQKGHKKGLSSQIPDNNKQKEKHHVTTSRWQGLGNA
jgi:hypothetical protein